MLSTSPVAQTVTLERKLNLQSAVALKSGEISPNTLLGDVPYALATVGPVHCFNAWFLCTVRGNFPLYLY